MYKRYCLLVLQQAGFAASRTCWASSLCQVDVESTFELELRSCEPCWAATASAMRCCSCALCPARGCVRTICTRQGTKGHFTCWVGSQSVYASDRQNCCSTRDQPHFCQRQLEDHFKTQDWAANCNTMPPQHLKQKQCLLQHLMTWR